MPVDPNLVQRTDAKLGYARLHLDELREYPRLASGDDWERAHEESILYHLVGVRDAFFQEINSAHGLGLNLSRVNERTLTNKLKQSNLQSRALEDLVELSEDSTRWFSLMMELRNHGCHRGHMVRLFNVGVGSARNMPKSIHFKDPRTGEDIEEDSVQLLGNFCDQMERLISKLRLLLP